MMLSRVAATMMSMSACSSASKVGLMTYSPLMRATRTSEIGPLKGTSDTASAAEAAWNKFSNNGGTVGSEKEAVYMDNGQLKKVVPGWIPSGAQGSADTKSWAAIWVE